MGQPGVPRGGVGFGLTRFIKKRLTLSANPCQGGPALREGALPHAFDFGGFGVSRLELLLRHLAIMGA
jgi:hypothetical protein